MADTKMTGLVADTTMADSDIMHFVDLDDTTMDASGSNQKITVANVKLAVNNFTAVNYTGTTDTLALTDAWKMIYYSNSSQVDVTIPTNASVAFPVGTRMMLLSTGAGGVTLTTTSLTLLGSSPNKTIVQNEAIYIEKTATDTWAIVGGTAA